MKSPGFSADGYGSPIVPCFLAAHRLMLTKRQCSFVLCLNTCHGLPIHLNGERHHGRLHLNDKVVVNLVATTQKSVRRPLLVAIFQVHRWTVRAGVGLLLDFSAGYYRAKRVSIGIYQHNFIVVRLGCLLSLRTFIALCDLLLVLGLKAPVELTVLANFIPFGTMQRRFAIRGVETF